jgi:hypothetical protein
MEADHVTADLLRDELLRLPGVESADVEGDALTPQGVRVRLAAGVDATEVGEQVQRVLAAHGLRSEMARPATSVTVETLTQVSPRATKPRRMADEILAKVAIVEGKDGITVRAETDGGRTADRAAAAGGERLDDAVVGAVSELAGVSPTPIILAIDDREVEGTPMVTILVEAGHHRLAGSCVIDGGRPYALGRATWTALKS